jgi:hypothetical protein
LKKLAFLGGAIGLGVGALLVAQTSHAADHADAPALAPAFFGQSGAGQPMADINDVFAWMTTDHSKVNLAMTISPADDGTHAFSQNVLYVWHVTALPMYTFPLPTTGVTQTNVICRFMSNTFGECWIGTVGYISGDPSSTAGLTNADGSIRLFAGPRSDPFFFNFQGFRNAVKFVDTIEIAQGSALFDSEKDAAGCLSVGTNIGNGNGSALRKCLFGDPNLGAATTAKCPGAPGSASPPCATDSPDCFAHLNVMAIVLQFNASLVSSTASPVIGVWGATHAAM